MNMKWLYVVLALFFVNTAYAGVSSSADRKAVKAVITYTNFEQQFDDMPSLVKKQLETSYSEELSQDHFQRLSNMFLDSFDAEKSERAMTRQLIMGYDRGRYRMLMKKLHSDTIKKMVKMELAAYDESDKMAKYEMEQYIFRLEHNPPSSKRRALVRELVSASGKTNIQVRTQTTLYELVHELVAVTAPTKAKPNLDWIHENSLKLKEHLQAEFSQRNQNEALFVFREATDEELEEYIQFQKSALGNWYKETLERAWIGAIRDIGRDITWKMNNSASDSIQTAHEDLDFLNNM